MATTIFISYRREDSRYQARRIYDALVDALPPESVFMDVDSIPPGVDFVETLEGWVKQCDVLLALIGPGWVNSTDPRTGQRRLDNPDDFVRIELRVALSRGIPVVPVLLDTAQMPMADQLPDEITQLLRRNAEYVEFRTFDADVQRLVKRLRLGQSLDRQAAGPADLARRQIDTAEKGVVDKRVGSIGPTEPRPEMHGVHRWSGGRPWLLAIGVTGGLPAVALASVFAAALVPVEWRPAWMTRDIERVRQITEATTESAAAAMTEAQDARRAAQEKLDAAKAALASSDDARKVAEEKAANAAAARIKAESARAAAETAAENTEAALAKSEAARRAAEMKAADAVAALAKSEGARRDAEAKAKIAANDLATSQETQASAEAKAAAATTALNKAEEARRAAESKPETIRAAVAQAEAKLAKSEGARREAEARATTAADNLVASREAQAAAEAKAVAATTALKQAEEARRAAESKLETMRAALAQAEAKLATAVPDRGRTITPNLPATSRMLLDDMTSPNRWAIDGKCRDATKFYTVERGNGYITWHNGSESTDETIYGSGVDELHTVTRRSSRIRGENEPAGTSLDYVRNGNIISVFKQIKGGITKFSLYRCW